MRRLSIVDSIQSAYMGDICSRKISFFTKINLRCEWSIKIYVKLQRLSIKAVVYNDLTPKLVCFMISDCPDRICFILRVIITTCHEIFFIYMDKISSLDVGYILFSLPWFTYHIAFQCYLEWSIHCGLMQFPGPLLTQLNTGGSWMSGRQKLAWWLFSDVALSALLLILPQEL